MKRSLFALLVVLVSVPPAFADKEFDEWLHKRNKELQGYKSAADAEFSKFLKVRWKNYNLYRGVEAYEKPKPAEQPKLPRQAPLPENDTPEVNPPADFDESPPSEFSRPQVIKPAEKEAVEAVEVKNLTTDFFGRKVALRVLPELLALRIPNRADSKKIAEAWKSVGTSNYEPLVEQLKKARATLKINDWGYGNLVQKTGANMFPDSPNSARFMTWFLMLKSGYDVRLAYSDGRLVILVSVKEMLHDTRFIKDGAKRYFNTGFGGKNPPRGRLVSYPKSYPGDLKPVGLRFSEFPALGRSESEERKLDFKFRNRSYSLKLAYDKNYIRYVGIFPPSSLPVYLAAPMNPTAGPQLLKFAAERVRGKSQAEAVNFLLGFIHNAIKYKTDNDQFGFEKYFYPDEVIHYPFADCEDRVALFSYLVRNLLKLEVVGLKYPNHLAAAVRFNGEVTGDAVTLRGAKYTVADPTFINASVGETMPAFKNVKPQIIEF